MKKVLCIGSVTTDVIVTPADSIPEPGILRAVDSVSTHVGGCAANAAIDLAKLGVTVILSCKVGDDNFGNFVMTSAKNNGVDIRGIVQDDSVSTTASIACINSVGERSFLYNPGSTSAFEKKDIPAQLVDECDIVFVAGAMLLTAFDGKPCAEFLKEAQAKGKYTIMDTAWDFQDIWLPKVIDSLPFLDLFMPSVEEASKLTGQTDPNKIADRLFEMDVKNLIIKLGKEGAMICPAGAARTILPTYKSIKPVDTTGAGDAFCAGFITGLTQGWDYIKSGAFANAVGTHCIMEIGASTGIKSIAETLHFMETHSL
ncbi:MAG: carbohydrate kinase family protein [Oscillospiraceae bacterium]|nr:carbohydrate kinase family protein [Oscillospiraceae bacterium]MDD4413077.1 carbohydrate kinase family protein [Oscillospiraceae bacterium]